MGKKGMGWVPDYPDVRDCTLKHDKVRKIQNGQQVNNDYEVDRTQQLLELIKSLKPSLANLNTNYDLRTLEETFEKEIDSKLHFVSATFVNGFLSLGSQGKDVQDLQDKFSKLGYLIKENDKTKFNWDVLDQDSWQLLKPNLLDPDLLAFWWKWYCKIQKDRPWKSEALDLWFDSLVYHLISRRADRFDPPGVFGKETELAIKAFQVNQLLSPTGIFTAITKAELLALVSIVSLLGRSSYRQRVSGPGVIYINILLQKHSQLKFDQNSPLDLFSAATSQAVREFQKNNVERFGGKSGDGIVDQDTWNALINNNNDHNNDKKRRQQLPSAPVPKKQFNKLKEIIFEVIKEKFKASEEGIVEQLGGWEKIDQYLFGESNQSDPISKQEKIKRRLEPIIEVLIQLVYYQSDGKSLATATELESAVKNGCDSLVSMIDPKKPDPKESAWLALVADRLEQGRGYVSSNIFRYPTYRPGTYGPAITYIQERLQALGYYSGSTTGYFDEQLTQDAIKQFQIASQIRQLNTPKNIHSQPKSAVSPPDGIFKLRDIESLTNVERFIKLEPPLPDNLTDSLIADLGGFKELLDHCKFTAIDQIVSKIQQAAELSDWITVVQAAIPTNILDASSEATLKKIVQGVNDFSKSTEEKQALARQFLELSFQLTLHPIAKVVAQLIAPIGKYSDSKEAFRDGLKRFRVIAYFSQVQKIDRILNGLIVDVSGDIDGLTKEYEPLVKTLAILKAEFRQQELPETGLDSFEQLQSLVVSQ